MNSMFCALRRRKSLPLKSLDPLKAIRLVARGRHPRVVFHLRRMQLGRCPSSRSSRSLGDLGG